MEKYYYFRELVSGIFTVSVFTTVHIFRLFLTAEARRRRVKPFLLKHPNLYWENFIVSSLRLRASAVIKKMCTVVKYRLIIIAKSLAKIAQYARLSRLQFFPVCRLQQLYHRLLRLRDPYQ